ncbi:FAD-dependent thymidylate synthase [Candidatus Pacearchaeota archaeon]|nr:FAD-dependent thymidylate synthase [Candidatus Pacearchaeota archaeon]
MELIKASCELIYMTIAPEIAIERAARTCYKSNKSSTEESRNEFITKLIKSGHLAMIEHAHASFRCVVDRGVSHEIVRHRLFSFAQESTRYCNYKGGVTFIIPPWIEITTGKWSFEHVLSKSNSPTGLWFRQMLWSERVYIKLIKEGWSPQQARSVLPNSLKTEIVITGNLREWRYFFELRTAPAAHPQMQEIANQMLTIMKVQVPVIFRDI